MKQIVHVFYASGARDVFGFWKKTLVIRVKANKLVINFQ
uniref:Uncharacterized protein n=1 Tax=Rhizophora mucronata TaxID=61149 RepID=A0A2P2Q331_RHIMU